MKRFRKRTIALVLASVITVAGSFATENYKNSLMKLNFTAGENGAVNMSVETKTAYSGNVTPIRRDANTFMLTLPEMNSKINGAVDLQNVSGNVESVEVKTLPYTNTGKGYTRIIIKTNSATNITGQNKIFVPTASEEVQSITTSSSSNLQEESYRNNERVSTPEGMTSRRQEVQTNGLKRPVEQPAQSSVEKSANIQASAQTSEINSTFNKPENEKESFEAFLLVLAILLVFSVSIYLSIRAKNKIQEITGEKIDIDVTEEDAKPKKDSKRKQLKNAIKKLDSIYSKTAVSSKTSEYTQFKEPVKTVKPAEELNVVDLDELFKEQQEKIREEVSNAEENSENEALEDFLNGFSFDEEETEEPLQEQGYDAEYYDRVINKAGITFSKDDVDCMNQLLMNEINNEAIENLRTKNSLKPAALNKLILEDLVSTYTISQNITFTSEDIQTLKKLMSVEIDSDFITDLRTNPERTKQMEQEIISAKPNRHRPSEILTLNVKDMLPDLSEALRKQGGRKIESEVQPITVYASEGYEVSTLSLQDELPDLSIEIKKEHAYESKPSAEIEIVDNTWEVEKLDTAGLLPDLKEVIKNPELYNQPETKPVKVDEEALLNNISNVQFKPFYDGNNDFEIINNFDIDNIKSQKQENNKIKSQNTEHEVVKEEKDKPNKKEFVLQNLERKKSERANISKLTNEKLSNDIMEKIEATKAERLQRREKVLLNKQKNTVKPQKEELKVDIKFVFDSEAYTVLSMVEFSEGKGCYLAKNDSSYAVIGFIGKKYIKIMQYDDLKSEKIIARLNKKIDDNTSEYIVRIGLKKFILTVTEDNMEYMMAL